MHSTCALKMKEYSLLLRGILFFKILLVHKVVQNEITFHLRFPLQSFNRGKMTETKHRWQHYRRYHTYNMFSPFQCFMKRFCMKMFVYIIIKTFFNVYILRCFFTKKPLFCLKHIVSKNMDV